MVKTMFRDAWDIRGAQLAQESKSYEKQIADAQKQIDVLLDRIVEADNATVIKAYEKKIASLEKEKIILQENNAKPAPTTRDFSASLELSLNLLSKPCKLWESSNISLRRTVLKLVFTDHLSYCRATGARTPKLSMSSKL